MNWYKIAQENKEKFSDLFGDDFFNKEELIKKHNRKIISKEKVSEPITINLYRNFDADMNKLEKINGNYVLSPEKSEQGVIWFAHDLQSNPQQYYDRGGKYLLIYPLQIQKEYYLITYENGETEKQDIYDGDYGIENSSKWGRYILPEGFMFSYKVQKHIICNKKLIVSPEQISIITENTNELV
ncbi:MAG: hypothetical protein WC942_11440 [Clostridia bacterium]|jgi:hypothetical protein